jgi:hypothetical protein
VANRSDSDLLGEISLSSRIQLRCLHPGRLSAPLFHSGRNRISHGDENTITAAASVSASLRCKLTLASVPIE